MANKIIHKRSFTTGSIPTTSSLDVGEIALNIPDGKMYLHKSGSNGQSIESAITSNSTASIGVLNMSGSLILSGSTDINSGSVFDVSADNISYDFDSLSFSGSAEITGSLAVTGGITGSFTGSYVGDGAGLYNIPAGGIVGLNLSQIASGSVSASISPTTGLQVNTNVTAPAFTGSFSGSFQGDGSGLTGVGGDPFPYTGSALITGSLAVTGSLTSRITSPGSSIWVNHFSGERYGGTNLQGRVYIKTNYPFVEDFYIGKNNGTANNDTSTNGGIHYSHQGQFTVRNTQTTGFYGITLDANLNLTQRVGIDTARNGFGLGWSLRNFTNSVDYINFAHNSSRVGIGWNDKTSSLLAATLDVKAQGALSTDTVFRVRNSANTSDLFLLRGDGTFIFRNTSGGFVNHTTTETQFFRTGGQINVSGGSVGYVTSNSPTFIVGNNTRLVYYNNGNMQLERGAILQTSGVGCFSLKNADTIPSANTADRITIYSADITAGNAAPHFRTENGSIIKLYKEIQPALSGSANTGDAATDALIEAMKTIILNLGLGASS